ncbi:MAG: hypothetical protein ACFCU9_06915 [Cyanophyceae cyanobacterium]
MVNPSQILLGTEAKPLLRLPASCPSAPTLTALGPNPIGAPSTGSPPRPIIQIEAQTQTLYAELIQSGAGGVSWIRPLFLVTGSEVWDLQLDADVLWKGSLTFSYAEEVLPLSAVAQSPLAPRQLLQAFLKQACALQS